MAVLAAPARAQTPEDLVRWIYTSLSAAGPADAKGLSYLTAPDRRSTFLSQRLVAFHNANDSFGNDLAAACVDFALDVPGQDFDAAEIARTLEVTTQDGPDGPQVTASFTNFGEAAQIAYDFVAQDGTWRIDDIAGPGWRVSDIPCAPRSDPALAAQSAVPTPGVGAQYCFVRGEDTLRLDVRADGRAAFDFVSWQVNFHSCGWNGIADPVAGGWDYATTEDGQACRIEFRVTPEGDITLGDPDGTCKRWMCGQRAVLDGIRYPRSSQVDCAAMPAE